MASIFVFGSNLAGRHGKGAAKTAASEFGARYGVGEGRTGQAYAIPTKDERLRVLPVESIAQSVSRFIAYARQNPNLEFKVTAIGTGLAGYRHEQIAPMFNGVPNNCHMPDDWRGLYETER